MKQKAEQEQARKEWHAKQALKKRKAEQEYARKKQYEKQNQLKQKAKQEQARKEWHAKQALKKRKAEQEYARKKQYEKQNQLKQKVQQEQVRKKWQAEQDLKKKRSENARKVAVQQKMAQAPRQSATRANPAPATNGHLVAGFKNSVQQAINTNKKYPRRAHRRGQQGTVVISFTLLRNGSITNIRVTRSSNHNKLDQAAMKAVRSINGRIPIPNQLNKASWNFSIPIQFRLQ